MKVLGREVNFCRTVGATCKIAEMYAREGGKPFAAEKPYERVQRNCAELIEYMSEGHEALKAYQAESMGEQYSPSVFTRQDCMMLDLDTFDALFAEAFLCYAKDKITVQASSEKKRELAGQ